MEYVYDRAISRNLGIFSPEEQEKIRNLTVGIAGVGGVGGNALLNLARMGVQNFIIADPDVFDFSNFNRQQGAYINTLGKNKCESLKEVVNLINPEANVKTYTEGLTENNIDEFIKDADVVIDGLDFFCIKLLKQMVDTAMAKGKYVFGAPILGFGTALYVFSPKGPSFEEYFGTLPEEMNLEYICNWAMKVFKYIPEYIDPNKYIETFSSVNKDIPSNASSGLLSAAVLSVDLILFMLRNVQPVCLPKIKQYDMAENKILIL